jgi:hypothetical protein
VSTAQKIADALDLDLEQVLWPLAHVVTPYPSKSKRRTSGLQRSVLSRQPHLEHR